jgi:anti-sigma factor (TIGR02949 family)
MSTDESSNEDQAQASLGHAHAEGECTEVVRDLYLYLDEEIDADRRQAVLHHLEECSPCFEAFDFEAELRTVVVAHNAQDCPEPLRQRIMGKLRDILGESDTEWGGGPQPA